MEETCFLNPHLEDLPVTLRLEEFLFIQLLLI
jgi:hypothetical protein